MRVLVVGSSRHEEADQEAIQAAAREIGKELARRGHTVLIGSDDERDVDPHVVAGALEAGRATTRIEVHVPKGLEQQYPDLTDEGTGQVVTVWHQFPDWDVTSMEVIRTVDAVLAVGGRLGVIHAGISAWMMGKPVVPVGSFGGGAATVGEYGSSRRAEFYHGGLDDAEIDRLASPWGRGPEAEFVVNALERVARAATIAKVPRRLLLGVLGVMAAALVVWIVLLTYPFVVVPLLHPEGWDNQRNFLLLFPTVSAAGLFGATMQTLRAIRDGKGLSGRVILVDTTLGLAAGMVAAILYLLAQVGRFLAHLFGRLAALDVLENPIHLIGE